MKSKQRILKEIQELISQRNPKLNKKAKRLAMKNNVRLGKLRQEFCQICFYPLGNNVRIKKGYKIIRCDNCGKIYRFRLEKK